MWALQEGLGCGEGTLALYQDMFQACHTAALGREQMWRAGGGRGGGQGGIKQLEDTSDSRDGSSLEDS